MISFFALLKFKYGDKVKIEHEFYGDIEGIWTVVACREYPDNTMTYKVIKKKGWSGLFKDQLIVTESQMEKIEE